MPSTFRTKKAIKIALAVGSRWAMEREGSPESYPLTIVRASSSSRWLAFDDAAGDRPTWLPVSDTRDWVVNHDGFTDTYSGVRLRYLAPAPADADPAHYARAALAPNRRAGNCGDCGGHVPAEAGHIRRDMTGWTVLHAYGACAPAAAAACPPAKIPRQ